MKRLLSIIASAALFGGVAHGDACTNDLVGAGIVASQARAICAASVSAVGQDFLPKTDGTYDLGSSSYEWEDLYVDGTANIDTLNVDVAMTYDAAAMTIFAASADAADSQKIQIGGGGAALASRGAVVQVLGNEATGGTAGALLLQGGAAGAESDVLIQTNDSAADILFNDDAGTNWSIDSGTNAITQNGTNGGDINFAKAQTGINMASVEGKITFFASDDQPASPVEGTIYLDTNDDDCAENDDDANDVALCLYQDAEWILLGANNN